MINGMNTALRTNPTREGPKASWLRANEGRLIIELLLFATWNVSHCELLNFIDLKVPEIAFVRFSQLKTDAFGDGNQ
eukprot:6174389-Pleurochrysis_carterae.AAC.3